MKRSKAGLTGNSAGSLGGASRSDLERGFSTIKDEPEGDGMGASPFFRRGCFGQFGDYNPEQDSSIDREYGTDDNWE